MSVSTDARSQKMRVCRLFVAARHDGEQITDAVIENIYTVPDFDATEDYVSRPENAQGRVFGVAVGLVGSDCDVVSDAA